MSARGLQATWRRTAVTGVAAALALAALPALVQGSTAAAAAALRDRGIDRVSGEFVGRELDSQPDG